MKEVWADIIKGLATVIVAALTVFGLKRFTVKKQFEKDERQISIEQLQYIIEQLTIREEQALNREKAAIQIKDKLLAELTDLKIQMAKISDQIK